MTSHPSPNQTMTHQQSALGSMIYSPLPTHGQPMAHHVSTAHLSPPSMQYYTPPTFEQEPPWVNKMISHIDTIKRDIMGKIEEVSSKVTQLEKDMTAVHQINERVNVLEESLSAIWDHIENLKNDAIYEKGRSMRDNLVFHGLRENAGENTEDVVRNFVHENMGFDCSQVEIMRSHRMGARHRNKPRPIVVKFLRFSDKEKIKKSGRSLRGTAFGVSDQFPREINERRRLLIPILKHEKQQKGHAARANLVVDKLYTEDSTYSVVNGEVKRSSPQQQSKYREDQRNNENKTNRSDYLQQQARQINQHQQQQHLQYTHQQNQAMMNAQPNREDAMRTARQQQPTPHLQHQHPTHPQQHVNHKVNTAAAHLASNVADPHNMLNYNVNTTAAQLTSHVSDTININSQANADVNQSGGAAGYDVTNTPRTEVTGLTAQTEPASTAGTLTQVDPLTVSQSDTAWPDMLS